MTVDVQVLTFYKILTTVCVYNFEIVFRQNYDDMSIHLNGIFAKLNLERNCLMIKKKYFSCIMYKTLKKYNQSMYMFTEMSNYS
jgi:hypothetical protein